MGLNRENPFAGRNSYIDVPVSDTKPGSRQDNPMEVARRRPIEVKPKSLSNIIPSTQG